MANMALMQALKGLSFPMDIPLTKRTPVPGAPTLPTMPGLEEVPENPQIQELLKRAWASQSAAAGMPMPQRPQVKPEQLLALGLSQLGASALGDKEGDFGNAALAVVKEQMGMKHQDELQKLQQKQQQEALKADQAFQQAQELRKQDQMKREFAYMKFKEATEQFQQAEDRRRFDEQQTLRNRELSIQEGNIKADNDRQALANAETQLNRVNQGVMALYDKARTGPNGFAKEDVAAIKAEHEAFVAQYGHLIDPRRLRPLPTTESLKNFAATEKKRQFDEMKTLADNKFRHAKSQDAKNLKVRWASVNVARQNAQTAAKNSNTRLAELYLKEADKGSADLIKNYDKEIKKLGAEMNGLNAKIRATSDADEKAKLFAQLQQKQAESNSWSKLKAEEEEARAMDGMAITPEQALQKAQGSSGSTEGTEWVYDPKTGTTKPSRGGGSRFSRGGGPKALHDTKSAAEAAGFKGEALVTAIAVALAESAGNPKAHNPNASTGDNSYGLWQINMLGGMGPERRRKFGLASNDQLFDPVANARAAYQISGGGKNWRPWTTYTSGKYKQYLDEARRIVNGS